MRTSTRALLAFVWAWAAAVTGCIFVPGYDFGGYRQAPVQDASSPPDASCIPFVCRDLHAECGKVPDGCGGVLDCGVCETGVCGVNGANRCGDDPCSPRSCADL